MDKLQAMHVFQTVVDEGGFAAAARALDMSPAGVTRYVSDLEASVGARLLQRTTRKVSLTEAGEAYIARVRHILNDVEDARAVAQAHTLEIAGVLRIAASPLLATHLLAPAIAGFRRLHPQVTFDVSVETAGHAHSVNEFDIRLLSAPPDFNGNLIARPIITAIGVLCASPEYLAERGVPLTPDDLKQHDCLQTRHPDRRVGVLELTHPEADGLTIEVRVQPVLLVNFVDTVLRALLDGAGIGTQPMELVAPHLNKGRLVRVLAPWTTGQFTLYAALPSRKFLPARTHAFLDYLTECTRESVHTAMQRAVESP
ncbi:LysR family transcriptional regulator [Diaphorobacter aerolatus]|uniref:LysR family transcriptional regulator n=1 Tax=Diaphorobacter aerolatus TaxID=1288495 RepID=A0A7H0GHQ6_9BURK|nr:LysR family transcriptional regulator [Diaphorobacter aerolatus]QNP47822.1 LysR family transcriptional regulator [Diaphorobacter aerolatus]